MDILIASSASSFSKSGSHNTHIGSTVFAPEVMLFPSRHVVHVMLKPGFRLLEARVESSVTRNRTPLNMWGFIKDPLYGYIRITETEKNVIDSDPVQRLRRIRQLSGAEYVYPAASHTRFEHALGSMHLAGVLGESIPFELDDASREKLKIAALLHDVGHGPFSHVFESLLMKSLQKTHEDMVPWIIEKSDLADILRAEGHSPSEIGKLAIGGLRDPKHRFFDQVIRSSVDVDKMDFIVRDSYHTGAGYGYVDVFRLIYTMDTLDGNLAVDVTAIPTLETFLIARLESFRAIYFHRASRAVQIMLVGALEEAKDDLGLLRLGSPKEYLALDDYTTWSMLAKHEKTRKIIEDIRNRRLLKCSYEKTFFTKDEMIVSIFTKETVRRQIEAEIASKAGVRSENVQIDVPSLPSVPYRHAIEIEPMEIPVFYRTKHGDKISKKLTEISKVIDTLRSFMNIVRVYTREEYKEQVSKASEEVLGKPPLSSAISY